LIESTCREVTLFNSPVFRAHLRRCHLRSTPLPDFIHAGKDVGACRVSTNITQVEEFTLAVRVKAKAGVSLIPKQILS